MRVLVIGNSVALYVRPRSPGAKPYGRRLAELLSSLPSGPPYVEIWAGNSLTVRDLLNAVEDRLVGFAPDVVIVNVGIVECTPRVLPQRLRQAYVRGRTRWQRLWLAAEAMIRRTIVSISGGAPAMTPASFGAALRRLAVVAQEEAGAKVLCLGLPPTSPRILAEVPGMEAHIRSFDATIRRVCEVTGSAYLDVGTLVRKKGGEIALPDGVHFSAEGHAAIAEGITDQIRSNSTPLPGAPPPTRALTPPAMRIRVLGALAALPLTVVALSWLTGVKVARALRRQKGL